MNSLKDSSYVVKSTQKKILDENGKIPKIIMSHINERNIDYSQTKNLNTSSLRQEEDEERYIENTNKILNKNMKALSSFKIGLLKTMDEKLLFEKVQNFQSYSKKVKALDFLIGFIDFASVCFFYNEHFNDE